MAKRDTLANMVKFKELDGEGNLIATRYLNRKAIASISVGNGEGMVAVMKNGDFFRLPPGFDPDQPTVPYDAEVEYIEATTGTQYINTGVYPTPAHCIQADFEFTRVDVKQQRVFECYDRSGHLFIALYINGKGNIGYAWSQTAADWKSASATITTDRKTYVMDGPNRLLKVGSTTATLPLVENTGPGNANLTLGSYDQTGVKPTYGRWYSASIYYGDILVRDYIPVRVGSGADAVGYLYDRANPNGGPLGNGLYGSANPNSPFIGSCIGPDKPLDRARKFSFC